MPPPHGLSRGNWALSSNSVAMPASPSTFAAVAPAGPAPTTMTSKFNPVVYLMGAFRALQRKETTQGRENGLDELDSRSPCRPILIAGDRYNHAHQRRIGVVVSQRIPGGEPRG